MGIIEQDYSSKCEKDTGKMLRTRATVTTKQKGGISIEWQPPASNSLCFIVNKFEHVSLVGWGPCTVRSKLYKSEHVGGEGGLRSWGPVWE